MSFMLPEGKAGAESAEDSADAASFYARSKALGEINNDKDITIRTSLVGPEEDENGGGLFNWFYNQKGDVNGFANAIWTGLTTIEFARGVFDTVYHAAFALLYHFTASPPNGLSCVVSDVYLNTEGT